MAFSTDQNDGMVNRYFQYLDGKSFFFMNGVEAGLPLTEDIAIWGSYRLKKWLVASKLITQILAGCAGAYMGWVALFGDGFGVQMFLGYIPAVIIGIALYLLTFHIAIRPFELKLFQYLGWQRRGWKSAYKEIITLNPKLRIVFLIWGFLTFAQMASNFGLINLGGFVRGDFAIFYMSAGVFSLFCLFVARAARSFIPPESTN